MKILNLDRGIERIISGEIAAPAAALFPKAKTFAPSGFSVVNHLDKALNVRSYNKKILSHIRPNISSHDVLSPDCYARSFEEMVAFASEFPADNKLEMEIKEKMSDLLSSMNDFHELMDVHRKSLFRG